MLHGSPIQILLVEDELAHAEIVRRNLADFRVANQVTHLADGQAALDHLQATNAKDGHPARPRPDLILLDLRLPKVDGIDVLRFLKADPELRKIPTIILTTSKAEQDILRAYDCGASSYLVKPMDFAQFASLMEGFGFYWLLWNQFPHDPRPPS